MLYKKITKSDLTNHTAENSSETSSSSDNQSSSEESDQCSNEESDQCSNEESGVDQKVPQIIELQTEIGYLKNKLKNKEFFYLEEKKNIVRFFLYILFYQSF